jgi:hypothetical protein
MKKILILMVLSGMLIPALASAALDYNAVDASYATTGYQNNETLTTLNLGFSRSISNDFYLAASYGHGYQTTNTSYDIKTNSISAGAGYHTPLKDYADGIAEGHITLGSAKWAGNTASANGYDIGAGIRAELGHEIEGTVMAMHDSISDGTLTRTDTFLNVRLGFNFLTRFQMILGIDLFKADSTSSLGVRFFY